MDTFHTFLFGGYFLIYLKKRHQNPTHHPASRLSDGANLWTQQPRWRGCTLGHLFVSPRHQAYSAKSNSIPNPSHRSLITTAALSQLSWHPSPSVSPFLIDKCSW
jgi:hypothetical protein